MFCVSCVHLLRYRKSTHFKIKSVLCVTVCSNINELSVQRAFVRALHEKVTAAVQIWKSHKKFKQEVVCVGSKDLYDRYYRKRWSRKFGKHLCETPESLRQNAFFIGVCGISILEEINA